MKTLSLPLECWITLTSLNPPSLFSQKYQPLYYGSLISPYVLKSLLHFLCMAASLHDNNVLSLFGKSPYPQTHGESNPTHHSSLLLENPFASCNLLFPFRCNRIPHARNKIKVKAKNKNKIKIT